MEWVDVFEIAVVCVTELYMFVNDVGDRGFFVDECDVFVLNLFCYEVSVGRLWCR